MARRFSPDAVGSRRLKAGFVGLVGASGALVAIQGDAAPLAIALATVGGLLAGLALSWYLSWIA